MSLEPFAQLEWSGVDDCDVAVLPLGVRRLRMPTLREANGL